ETEKRLAQEGNQAVATKADSFGWTPVYSKVSGSLPLSEVGQVGQEGKFVRFGIEVRTAGMVKLVFDPTMVRGIWVDGTSVQPNAEGLMINLESGNREFVVQFESGDADQDFNLEVVDLEEETGR